MWVFYSKHSNKINQRDSHIIINWIHFGMNVGNTFGDYFRRVKDCALKSTYMGLSSWKTECYSELDEQQEAASNTLTKVRV